ncbi:MAG: U32 family peptidase [Lachnobacterium sp.]|nr:U32 family peptidase [Lachnobacterium sp.]
MAKKLLNNIMSGTDRNSHLFLFYRMNMRNRDFELLAPAGNINIFKAVIEAGADAVYVGGSMFGARAYANNFDEEELLYAIDYAHLKGVKVYLTVNTLLKNDEIEKLYDYLLPFYERGLDAVLVQDLGALKLIHDRFPDLAIHTSTQMTVTGIDGVRFLKQFGVQRVVMAREVSLAEMKEIHEKCGMEIEAFVHGALCYSYSGQCLFSSMLGGRSGNRGRCAQPCRLPYCVGNKKDTYILSLKDMCGIKDLQKLKESGVYSLKIEGRMKQAGYASGVVAYYRRYIDSMKEVSDKDYKNIAGLGNRCGFTDKYYFEHNGTDMVTFEKPNFVSDASDELPQFSKIKIQGKLTLKEAEPGALTVSCGGYRFTSYMDPVSHALKAPAERKNVAERISKTGDTPFEFENIDITMDNDIFVPNGALNKLRREAIEGLQNEILMQYKRTASASYGWKSKKTSEIKPYGDPKVIASVRDGKQLYRLLEYDNISEIYIDSSKYGRRDFVKEFNDDVFCVNNVEKKAYLALPVIFRRSTRDYFETISDQLKKIDFEGFIVRNYEEFFWVKTRFAGKKIVTDHNMYTYNDMAKSMFFDNGADADTMPLELNQKEINRRNNKGSQMIIYGYYPLMVSAQCVHKNSYKCDRTPQITYLKDRYNKIFPVWNNCSECYNIIYNSCPTVLFNNMQKIKNAGIDALRLDFTFEKPEEIDTVMAAFESNSADGIKEYTNGHFKRGVE